MDTQNPGFKKALIVVAALLSLYLLVISIKEIKSISYVGRDVAVQNSITVTGTGDAVAVPDIATFTFGVTQEAPDVATAQKNATTKINAAVDFLKQNGVADKDVKTTSYNITPVYDYANGVCNTTRCLPSTNKLRGYEVSQMIEVKVRKTDDAGKLLAGIGGQGVTNVSGLNFSVDKPDDIQAQARQKAIDDAKTKAQTLASQLGVHLVRISSFNESGNTPIYFSKAYATGGAVMDQAMANPAPAVPSGEQKVTSNVTITYEIR